MLRILFLILCLALAALVLPLLAAGDADPGIERLLAAMTLREKIGQLFIVPVFSASTGPELTRYLEQLKPGGIIILGEQLENAYTVKRVCDRISMLHKGWRVPVPMFTSINQEGGIVNRLRINTALFPSAMALGATANTNLPYRTGLAIGRQLRAAGLNMNYAPVLDMNTNPQNQVIGFRAFADNAEAVLRFAAAFTRGLHDAGVIPVGKHFPGHGRTTLDSHWFLPQTAAPAAELYKHDFRIFRDFPRQLLPAVMTAHVVYSNIDSLPATLSSNIISGYFRGQGNYDGVIMTDDIFMGALSRRYPYPKIVELALKAGNDILSTSLPYSINSSLIRHIEQLVTSGVIPQARLDRSVRRILRLKQAYGLFNREPVPAATAADWFHGPEVTALARRAAHDAVTVMRDPGRILPLTNCGRTLVVSYKGDFTQHLTQLLLSRRLATRVTPLYIPYEGRQAHAARVHAAAAGYDTIVYGGGGPPDIRALTLLARYPGKRLVAVSFHDPYWPGEVPGSFSYVATFSYFPVSALAAADKLAGVSPFTGVPPVKVFP